MIFEDFKRGAASVSERSRCNGRYAFGPVTNVPGSVSCCRTRSRQGPGGANLRPPLGTACCVPTDLNGPAPTRPCPTLLDRAVAGRRRRERRCRRPPRRAVSRCHCLIPRRAASRRRYPCAITDGPDRAALLRKRRGRLRRSCSIWLPVPPKDILESMYQDVRLGWVSQEPVAPPSGAGCPGQS